MNIFNGYAGCGKTYKIKEDINNLLENGVLNHNILIITLNSNKKPVFQEILPNICVKNFSEVTYDILKKLPLNLNKKKVSDFLATQIIQSLAKDELSKNYALKNLVSSNSFARELYNLFGLFKINKFDKTTLIDAIKNSDITEEDKSRFEIISNIYEKYTKFLNEQNFLDYRDEVLICIETLKNNDYFKNINKHIFVCDAQNLTTIQLELLTLLSNEEKLYLYGDNNAKIQTFQGANAFKKQLIDYPEKSRNKDILKRALFITGNFLESDKTDAIKYRTFPSFNDEIEHIAEEIICNVNNGANYSDFAIIIRNNTIKENIVDLFNKYQIPVNGQIYSEDYQLFKYKFSQYLNIFELLEKLNIENFDENNFDNIKLKSQIDLDILSEQLNLLTENILNENLYNKFLIKKLMNLKEQNNYQFLIQAIYKNSDNINENDKNRIDAIFEKLNELYQYFKQNDYVKIVLNLADFQNIDDENYHKFLAIFMNRLQELQSLKNDILKEKIDTKTILELLETSLENNDELGNKVNILTVFKSSGLEFKKVFIPNLIENYFPKKANYTQFISEDANEKLSLTLNKINYDFENIIPDYKQELKDEEHLMYVVLTRAKEQVILSTHQFENKKQVVPSSFFEQLKFADEQNFDKQIKSEESTKEVELEENTQITREQDFVINKDDKFKLSASTISDFLSCPQKFYYKNLLGLKEESIYEASYGKAIHAIFEVLLSKYLKDFSLQKAIELGDILFNSNINPQKAIETGFKQETIDDISKIDPLTFEEMKKNFIDVINQLEAQGYFTVKPCNAICEKKFNFNLKEYPNITFKGFIDAIVTDEYGTKLLDYKTGRNKKKLKNIFSEDGLNFLNTGWKDKGLFSEKNVKSYEYQIPLYYLACLNSKDLELYKDKIKEIGYQYLRPSRKQGCSSDFITVSEIEGTEEKIIDNLKTYVIDELYNKTEFEANYSSYNCKECAFFSICDATKSDEGEENNGN